MATVLNFQLLSQQSEVPRNKGGLYMFRLRFPTDYELGLYLGNVPELSRLVALAGHYLQKVERTLASRSLEGSLVEIDRASHLQISYSLEATVASFDIMREVQGALGHAAEAGALRELFEALRTFFEFLPPLYVGMTSKQSLGERLQQHLDNTTKLHERLRACGITWGELSFTCVPIEESNLPKLRSLEKIFQSICKPQLSLV